MKAVAIIIIAYRRSLFSNFRKATAIAKAFRPLKALQGNHEWDFIEKFLLPCRSIYDRPRLQNTTCSSLFYWAGQFGQFDQKVPLLITNLSSDKGSTYNENKDLDLDLAKYCTRKIKGA